MLLRVDVVAAALEAVYGGLPAHRVVALTPTGRPLTQEVVEELAKEEQLTLLSARFEGFDERIVEHLCNDAISIGPYVVSNGDLPAMVAARRDRAPPAGRPRGRLGRVGVLLRSDSAAASSTRTTRARRSSEAGVFRRAPLGRPCARRALAEGARPVRNPIDRVTEGLPSTLRVTIDWLVTILGAILIVLAIKQWVINPYRIPSSSMEPTLNCAAARPSAASRPAGSSTAPTACSPAAICYDFSSPKRGDIVVFNTPPRPRRPAAPGGVYVKRLIGLPGDVWSEKDGYVYINGKKLNEPYIKPRVPRQPTPSRPSGSRRATTS